jgi:hypothetical protein
MRLISSRDTSFGAEAPGISTPPIDEIGHRDMTLDRIVRRVDGVERGTELRPQPAQHLDVAVEHPHVRLHPERDRDRVVAHDASAEHDDAGGLDARHAAEQHALPAARLLEVVRAGLHGHAARDLGHRREQRQAAVGEVTVSYATAIAPLATRPLVWSGSARGAGR